MQTSRFLGSRWPRCVGVQTSRSWSCAGLDVAVFRSAVVLPTVCLSSFLSVCCSEVVWFDRWYGHRLRGPRFKVHPCRFW